MTSARRTGFIGARYAMPWAEPFSFLAVRFCLAFAILAAAAVLLGAQRGAWPDMLHSIGAGALMNILV